MNLGFKQLCKQHSNQEVEYIHIHSEKSQILKCHLCAIQDQINPRDLVLIDHCIDQIQKNHNEEDDDDDDIFIKNWPPGINPILLNLIQNNLKVMKKDEIKQNILEYFELLEKELNENLQKTKKTILLQIESIDLEYNWAKEAYNQISQKDELSTIFTQNKDNLEDLNSKLSDLILSMKENSEDNINKIKKLYQEFIERNSYIDFQQPNLIKKLMIELFQNIRFYDGIQVHKDSNNEVIQEINQNNSMNSQISCQPVINFLNGLYKHFKKQKQSFQNNLIQNDEKIEKLNKGVDQFMTEAFMDKQYQSSLVTINDLCQILDQWFVKSKIENINLEDIIKNFNIIQESVSNTSISILDIQQQQIENLNVLINTMGNNNKKPNYSNYPVEYFENLIQADRLFTKEDLSQVSEVLHKYPIFDIKPLKMFKPIFNQFYKGSQFGQITYLNQKQTLYCNTNEIIVFNSKTLDNSKQYLIRFKLSQPFNQMSQILICLKNLTNNQLYYISNSNSQGISASKGQSLSYAYFINEIEMRISIQNNILVFTDFPGYLNVNSKTQSDPILNVENQYIILIQLTNAINKYVQITNFYEVEEFPQL